MLRFIRLRSYRPTAITSAAGLIARLAAGLLPAWIGTRVDAGDSLRAVERGGTETRGARAMTRTLLIGEIALACTLLAGATRARDAARVDPVALLRE